MTYPDTSFPGSVDTLNMLGPQDANSNVPNTFGETHSGIHAQLAAAVTAIENYVLSGGVGVPGLGQGYRSMVINGSILTADRGKLVLANGATAITMLSAATAGAGFIVAIGNGSSLDSVVTVLSGATFLPAYGPAPVTSIAISGGEVLILMSNGGSWDVVGGTGQQGYRLWFRDTSLSATVAANDRGKVIVAVDAGGTTITCPNTGDANIGNGFSFTVFNPSTTQNRTLTCGTSVFQRPFQGNGGVTGTTGLVLKPGESVTVYGNGGVWYVIGGTGTPVQSRAFIPDVVALTDAANIATDASAGNKFSVTIAASRTMAAPTNPTNGQTIEYIITQGGAGSLTITWDPIFHAGTTVALPTLSTTIGARDRVTFEYNSGTTQWDLLAYALGF